MTPITHERLSPLAERIGRQLTAPAEPGARFVLLVDPDGRSGPGALAAIGDSLTGGGARLALGWADREADAPYGPFPLLVAALARRLSADAPEVVSRHGQTVRSLAPGTADAVLEHVAPFEAQLLGCALQGNRHGLRDFFVGRNVQPRVLDDTVRFVLDAAAHPPMGEDSPLVLFVDRVEEGGRATVQALCRLRRYAAGQPLAVVAVWSEARGGDPAALGELEGAGWTLVPLPVDAGPRAAVSDPLSAVEATVLRSAAVLSGWRDADTISRACSLPVETVSEALEALRGRGLVAGSAGFGYAVPAAAADAVLAGLSPEERVALHRDALAVGGTPFEDARHAARAGAPGRGEHALRALEASWSVSAYDAAFRHAETAFADPEVAGRHNRDYLLGLLCYEARRFPESHEHLVAALEAEDDDEQRAILQRLIGYNGVFGLKRHDIALDYLDRARVYYEDQGSARDASWIRNTMAFGLMQIGRAGDAIALEQETLAEARALPYPDRFLLSILQLNLGRLHRGRSLDEALVYIRSAMADNRGDSGPYMLLLLYITLGNLYFSEGRAREAAAYYARCVDLSFDIDLAGFSDRTFPLLSRVFGDAVGPVGDGVALRGDVARLLCHFNLALSCRQAGFVDAAERYRRWARREIGRWGVPEYEAAIDALPAGGEPAADAGADDGEAIRTFLCGYPDHFAHRRAPEGGAEVGALVADGLAVAFLSGLDGGSPAMVHSYVLFDPRSVQVRSRVDYELGRQEQAGGVLALPEAAAWFEGADPAFPSVVQEVTLERAHRSALGGVSPIRTRLRFVDEASGELAAAVRAFTARTGVPFVGAVCFRRAGEEIADTPEIAAKYFLETALDRLFLDGFLVEKACGAGDAANLFPLRPRFSGYAAMPADVAPEEPTLVVSRNRFYRIGQGGTAVLSRCDGRTTVGELMGALPGANAPEVCGFLLQMRRHGVIHFTHG